MLPGAVLRNAAFTKVSAEGKVEEVALNAGKGNQLATGAANEARQQPPQSKGSGIRSRACRWACRWRRSWGSFPSR